MDPRGNSGPLRDCSFCLNGRCVVFTGTRPRAVPCPYCGRKPKLTEYQKKVLL